jgi:drug/metabolite transporter (DMT)-like permease
MSPFELGIVLLSALIHALWSVVIKGSRAPLAFNLVQAVPISGVFVALLATTAPLDDLSLRFWAILAGAGLFHGLYLYWLSLAYEQVDLTLAYPIARSTPAFLPLIAAPILGERLSLGGILGIAVVVCGMWAVQLGASDGDRPGSGRRRWLGGGIGYAYLALLATVGYGLTDKALMLELRASGWSSTLPASLFCFFAVWAAGSIVFIPMTLARVPLATVGSVAREEWPRAMGAAAIGVVGYGLILKAFETAPASYVVAVRQASVLFVLVMSVLWLKERPTPLRVGGAIATVIGVALIALAG